MSRQRTVRSVVSDNGILAWGGPEIENISILYPLVLCTVAELRFWPICTGAELFQSVHGFSYFLRQLLHRFTTIGIGMG
jgi:hypothetical protein